MLIPKKSGQHNRKKRIVIPNLPCQARFSMMQTLEDGDSKRIPERQIVLPGVLENYYQ